MNVITLLSEHISNQIAAGEVIQRPASVIKELLENAIDAGATEVNVFIKDAGRTNIVIQDNGKGMTPDDALLSFQRHSTSKLNNVEDLFKMKKKGFKDCRIIADNNLKKYWVTIDLYKDKNDAKIAREKYLIDGWIKQI